jgi:hypothetical protein
VIRLPDPGAYYDIPPYAVIRDPGRKKVSSWQWIRTEERLYSRTLFNSLLNTALNWAFGNDL